MPTKFAQIPMNAIFKTTSGEYRKIDDLYYEDLLSGVGLQSGWSPIFDTTILSSDAAPKADNPSTEAYIVDPQTRMMKKNPDYKVDNLAEEAFAEMWGSAQFDCGPEDYTYMGDEAVAAVKAMGELTKLVGLVGNSTVYPALVQAVSDFLVTSRWVEAMSKTSEEDR